MKDNECIVFVFVTQAKARSIICQGKH